ncbi:Rba50 protein [Candida orthopsilosis Co 90-125]|uniref:Rba50 protein n=1 Tax=Candida orthopsilosis (strain 90-125) TaxID=1136231 RepID=H8X825_CANO9|nr:Rba50 protein [Candida orthopsilosis Co 90-125]CCG24124.1 Rba50 protein [Candida orthopsilosis Co 90-125]
MDFVGEIIEHEIEPPSEPTPFNAPTGFPDPQMVKKVSRWKQKQSKSPTSELPPQDEPTTELTEAEKIDKENRERMAKMSESEILQERQEILTQLDPNLVRSLLKRSNKKKQDERSEQHTTSHDHDHHEHAEGYNGWIGGMKTAKGLTDLSQLEKKEVDKALGLDSERKVRFDDDKVERIACLEPDNNNDMQVESDLDAIAPEDYQLNQGEDEEMHESTSNVHFTKPGQDDLDLDDPEFFDKLHEKYFPDLPKETEKLSWMTKPLPKQVSTTYESISDMRFDFNGNLVQINIDEEKDDSQGIPTYLGLHHHSENPHMAGYTLSELVHLSRSVVPGQRCISIQTLGRILHKLGKHELGIIPVAETEENRDIKEMVQTFEKMMWDLIEELRIIDSITEAADEKYTKNLSVRSYAIEALYLIKTGK